MPDPPLGGSIGIQATSLGTELQQIMDADSLRPGDEVSYSTAKAIWLYHPLGAKIAENPIRLAQSQDRELTCPGSPEEDVVKAFQREWDEIEADTTILNIATQSRVYGLASCGMGVEGEDPSSPVDFTKLWKKKPYFNVFDPLNTSGLIVDQNPNSPTFQKFSNLRVGGQVWHRSRTTTLMNESPVYLAWTTTAFSYAGRSCYQRAFYPLRSYLNSMVVDDMVLRKAGLLVLKLESSSSVVDRVMQAFGAVKRVMLQQAKNDNVLSMGVTEDAGSLNLQNIDGAVNMSRNNVIKNIAVAVPMPAHLLTMDAYVEGFGEGTEDARAVAQYVDRVRIDIKKPYEWMDTITQYRAWTPEFYATIQNKYPEDYGDTPYEQAFYTWRNNFQATWPNLIKEPESALVTVDDIKLKAVIATVQVVGPLIMNVPGAMAELLQWMQLQINSSEHLFAGGKLDFDIDELKDAFTEERENQQQMSEQQLMGAERDKPAPPFSGRDSVNIAKLADAMLERRLNSRQIGRVIT